MDNLHRMTLSEDETNQQKKIQLRAAKKIEEKKKLNK